MDEFEWEVLAASAMDALDKKSQDPEFWQAFLVQLINLMRARAHDRGNDFDPFLERVLDNYSFLTLVKKLGWTNDFLRNNPNIGVD